MDKQKRTTDLVLSYYKYQKDKDITEFLSKVCDYFDAVKSEELYSHDIKFLTSFAQLVGVPQYVDLLLRKFQEKKIEINNLDLITLSALISRSSLTTDDNVVLHKYQMDMLRKFRKSEINRYLISAPTSFGKTFLTYQIIKKMEYKNIVLIFPTISLLSENYEHILTDKYFSEGYSIHTLSDDIDIADKNLWIFTPERFLSYLDRVIDTTFDFVFIDEIYKIDNEYIIDKDTITDNERDVAYRIALEYTCRKTRDIMLAGPFLEFGSMSNSNSSILNFINDKGFEIVNYNAIEIVKKDEYQFKTKKQYIIDDKVIKCGNDRKSVKVFNILSDITESSESTIVYCNTKRKTEVIAYDLLEQIDTNEGWTVVEQNSKLYLQFLEHIKNLYGSDWIVFKALKKGIGIHHGLIPKYIQKEIIHQFNIGTISVLISTTTITEGVNTSAKNIIVTSGKKGIKPLKHFDAKNIIGRAGRFNQHFSGRVIIIDNEFKKVLDDEEDVLKHKNYDYESIKNEVDYEITDEKYLKDEDIIKKTSIELEIIKRNIPHYLFYQFKVVNPKSKIALFDRIEELNDHQINKIKALIRMINFNMTITWEGFQIIVDVLDPLITDKPLRRLIDYKCKGDIYSVLVAKLYYYLKDGFFGLLSFELESKNKDDAIRGTAELVYNIFKYQLVKYLGVFDIFYKIVRSQKENKNIDEVGGLGLFLKKLEYNATNDNARILSDYGVPFKLIDYYENGTNVYFDEYEKYINDKIISLLKN